MTKRTTMMNWQIPFRASFAAGLLCLPACGLTSSARQQADHVFSTCSPIELEHQAGYSGVHAKAQYPAEGTVRLSDLGQAARYDMNNNGRANYPTATDVLHGNGPIAPGPCATSAVDGDGSLRPVSWNVPAETTDSVAISPYRFANYRVVDDSEGVVRASFIAAEPRIASDPRTSRSQVHQVAWNQMETVAAGPMPDQFPDEYVMDGGDRSTPVHYEGGTMHGLETEDTVAAFNDNTGQHRVKPSNRVAVYAPRFGSVRTVSGLETDLRVDKAAGAGKAVSANGLNMGLAASEHVRGQGISGLETRNRADGVEVAMPTSQTAQSDRPETNHKVDQGMENRKYTNSGALGQFDAAVLSKQAQNAVAWSRNQFPQMSGSTSGAGDLQGIFKVQQSVGVEDNRKTNGDLRLVKLADRDTAQSGDTVKFTIRFENTGDFDVYDVAIVDNLTTRLEYVEATAAIDAANPGEVVVTSNGEGSHVLTFRLDQPLKGHTGGTITFEAKVR